MNLPEIFYEDEVDEINLIIFGIPRRIYERNEYFNSFSNLKFFQRFRITKETCLMILNMIEEHIEYQHNLNNSVAPVNQLLLFLRFCATGSHLACVADFSGAHVSTASRLIVRVGHALASLCNRFVRMPTTAEEINEGQLGFYQIARFARVIGTLDGTHIRIQSPGGGDPEVFRNRKNYFSINVQVISSYNLKMLNIVFETNSYPNAVLLGDSAYYSKSYLMTPVQEPVVHSQELYNESHIRTRNTVERMIGVWKRRFPILAYGCRLKLETALMVIVATSVLHNICRNNNEEDAPDPEDIQLFVNMMAEDEVPTIPVYNELGVGDGDQIRRNLIDTYFAFIQE